MGAVQVVFERCLLVGPESLDIDGWRAAGHGGEFLPGDEPPSVSQRDQFADPVPIAGDGEGLPVLDRVHNLLGPVAEISLGDFRLRCHKRNSKGM
jgi:hypothetical protein